MLRQHRDRLTVETAGPGLLDITDPVTARVRAAGLDHGLATLFCRHTSASLLLQENADPAVLEDLENFFRRLVSRDPGLYRHRQEGADDMPAHIRSALTQSQLSIPLEGGRLMLGTWQGIYLFEHRDQPHTRRVAAHFAE